MLRPQPGVRVAEHPGVGDLDRQAAEDGEPAARAGLPAAAGATPRSGAPGKDIVYVVNGLAGDIYAGATGGNGNVTKTNVAWIRRARAAATSRRRSSRASI